MKRLILMVVVIMLANTFFLSVAAASDDSLHFSSEERSKLNVSSGDTVVKVFDRVFNADFAEQQDIETIVAKSGTEYLIIENGGTVIYKRYDKGEIFDMYPYYLDDAADFYKYAVSPELVFGMFTKVNAVYCLNGASSLHGSCIYYDTNHGQYVLYKDFLSDEEIYLFPLEVFYEATKAYVDALDPPTEFTYGTHLLSDVYDVENYLFTPGNHFDWIAMGLIVVVVFVSAIGIIYILRRRKKARLK